MESSTQIISVHPFRRVARYQERKLQTWLDGDRGGLRPEGLPIWANGVRVEKAGKFQWAVVATSKAGR